MTTFTTEDIEGFLTDWFPADVEPVYEGEYEVTGPSWPWPHRIEWNKKTGWAMEIDQWRGLKVKVE